MYLKLIQEQQSNYGSNVYEVELNEPHTILSFIAEVLNCGRNERGSIYIGGYNRKICEYYHSELCKANAPENELHLKVAKVTAIGSWGCMDYHIKVEEE